MTITRRVSLSFALMLLLFGLNLVVYFWASEQKADSLAELRSTADRRVLLRAIEHDLRDRSRESAILSEAVLEAEQLASLRARLEALRRRPRELGTLTPQGRRDAEEIGRALDRFADAALAVFTAATENRRAESRASRDRADRAEIEARLVIERVSRDEEQRATAAADRFFATTALTHQVSVVTFALSLLVTIAVGTHMAWRLRQGFSRLVRGTERIAQGDLAHHIEAAQTDELGALARAFNGMTRQLARAMSEASEARAAAERASRAKGAFLANMSHEFRTPLTSILCYADLLQQEATRTGQTRLAQDAVEMKQAADHLVALVSQVVDLARIESGRLTVTLEEVEIRPLADRLTRTVEPLAARNGNTLRVEVADGAGAMVIDALKLRQILLNLLANACKFTSKGTVTLMIQRSSLDETPAVTFRVIDTGIGMTLEQASRIFEEFEQGDPSIERGYGGSGLGLAISQRLCTLLGGTIDVVSKVGVGTTFTVVLPSQPVQPEPRRSASAA
jgi:signal transduction histidine kinase